MKKIVAYTDGGSRGNPGVSGAGVYIQDEHKVVLKEVSKFLGIGTNNRAEYEAVIIALTTIAKMLGEQKGDAHIEIRLDSELVQRQMNGVYRVKSPELRIQYEKICALRKKFASVSFTHVRREYNKEADRLANEAMDRGQ